MQVVCGVDCPHGDANRWSRLFNSAKDRERKQMTKMWIPFQLIKCFLSVHNCLERSGTLKEVGAVFHPTERNLSKRLGKFRLMMWNMVHMKEEAAGVRVLHLKGRRLSDPSFFGTICSALSFTESLEDLRIALPRVIHNDTQRLLWRWLAISVFHPQSRSKLQHLDLSQCNVESEDVEVVKDVLKREWSSVMLQLLTDNSNFQNLSLLQGETTLALIKSNTRIEAEPMRRMFSKPLITLNQAEQFLVLYQREDWICVYLPSFGCGFIKRHYGASIITCSSIPPSDKVNLTSLKLKTLDISATIALLRAIGSHLTRLNLDCEAFTNAHLKELLCCCPKLTGLTLQAGKFNDFSALIDASVAGTCKVASLHLLTQKVTTSCLENLTKKLSNPVLANTSRLRELRLQTGLLRRPDLEILLGLVKANRTLRCLRIKISFCLFDEYMPRLLAHRGDGLRGGEEDIKKLAFLSVVSCCRHEERARQRIDTMMLGKIFEFAYDGERLISLEEYTDRMTIHEIVARSNAT